MTDTDPGADETAETRTDPAAAAAAETIEGLVFVSNPDYPYPFNVQNPPRFWMEEQTGVLEQAVEAYMAGERLTEKHLAALKIYLKQYIQRAPLAGDASVPRLVQKIDRIKTTHDVENFADEAAEYGAEVF